MSYTHLRAYASREGQLILNFSLSNHLGVTKEWELLGESIEELGRMCNLGKTWGIAGNSGSSVQLGCQNYIVLASSPPKRVYGRLTICSTVIEIRGKVIILTPVAMF